MSRLTTVIVIVLLSAIVLSSLMVLLARKHDGPIEIFSGGPFTSGEVFQHPDDWSFLKSQMTVELQTMAPPSSRLMWLVVVDNRLYVISDYMTSSIGKVWKQWPRKLEEDNRAIVRVEGKLYEFVLERIHEGDQINAVLDRFNEKYRKKMGIEDLDSGKTWLFELKHQ